MGRGFRSENFQSREKQAGETNFKIKNEFGCDAYNIASFKKHCSALDLEEFDVDSIISTLEKQKEISPSFFFSILNNNSEGHLGNGLRKQFDQIIDFEMFPENFKCQLRKLVQQE